MSAAIDTCTCCTCGHQWQRGMSGEHSCATALSAENAALKEQVERLKRRAENVSTEEANELMDVLRTIAPTGRAFITSARELIASRDAIMRERDALRSEMQHTNDYILKLGQMLRVNGCEDTPEQRITELKQRVEVLEQDREILNWQEADMKKGDEAVGIEFVDGAFGYPYQVNGDGGFGGGVGHTRFDDLRTAIKSAISARVTGEGRA